MDGTENMSWQDKSDFDSHTPSYDDPLRNRAQDELQMSDADENIAEFECILV